MRLAGHTLAAIGETLDCTREAVRQALEREMRKRPSLRMDLDAARAQRERKLATTILDLRERGMSYQRIARRLRRAPQTVISLGRAYGDASNLRTGPRPSQYTVDPDLIRDMRLAGKSKSQIADQVGCHVITVHRHLQRMGVRGQDCRRKHERSTRYPTRTVAASGDAPDD